MTPHRLVCHPAQPAPPGLEVDACVQWLDQGGLALEYHLRGTVDAIRWPAPAPARATDGLWQHTCAEAFVAATGAIAYREFNFSPSGAWAAYDFAEYRQRSTADFSPRLQVDCQADQKASLRAVIPADALPPGDLDLGLTLVVETLSGDKSYWALAHAGAQPDFHLRESFALHLSRP